MFEWTQEPEMTSMQLANGGVEALAEAPKWAKKPTSERLV